MRSSSKGLAKLQLRPAIEFINENLDKDLKLAEIATVAGISQYYFARMFKKQMGVAPHQYVLQQRIERAKQLLATRQLSIAQVAEQVGFSNQSHFTAQFRKTTGTTPKGYRDRKAVATSSVSIAGRQHLTRASRDRASDTHSPAKMP